MMPESDFWTMLSNATLMVQLVLVMLSSMSVWSWTIIITKLVTIHGARKRILEGNKTFDLSEDLATGLKSVNRDSRSPLATIGSAAISEFRRLEKADLPLERKRMLVKDTLRRVLRQGVSNEMKSLSGNLSFLATCANAAPFIGLFGTVWGIMHSFHAIGLMKSVSLATVAPGISEALVATAIGLLVAIPAAIAYNFILGVLAGVETEMISFAGAFLNRIEREVAWASGVSDKPKEVRRGHHIFDED